MAKTFEGLAQESEAGFKELSANPFFPRVAAKDIKFMPEIVDTGIAYRQEFSQEVIKMIESYLESFKNKKGPSNSTKSSKPKSKIPLL